MNDNLPYLYLTLLLLHFNQWEQEKVSNVRSR